MKAAKLVVILAAFLLPGCAGSDRPESLGAPAPDPGDDAGSIRGTVVDEELRPIPGAAIVLIDSAFRAVTDPGGVFTLNDVPPGTYALAAERLGYMPGARRVEVTVGKVSTVELVLEAMAPTDPYVVTVPRTTIYHYGQRALNTYTFGVLNQSVVDDVVCNPCWFVLHHPPSPKQVVTETTWPGARPCPDINCDIFVYYKDEWTNNWYTGDGHLALYNNMYDRETFLWPEVSVGFLEGKDRVMLAFAPAYYGSVEQKVDVFTSFAYGADLPKDFSALPPEAG